MAESEALHPQTPKSPGEPTASAPEPQGPAQGPTPTQAEAQTAASSPPPPSPTWQMRLRSWLRRLLWRLAWMFGLVLVGIFIGYWQWARPAWQQVADLTAQNRHLQQELAQTKADLGQAQGRLQALTAERDEAQDMAARARQWMAYFQARAEVQAAHAALVDGQKTLARTHLTLARRALQQLAQTSTDAALQQAAEDLGDALETLLDDLETTSSSAAARRVAQQILPALDALEGLLPSQP